MSVVYYGPTGAILRPNSKKLKKSPPLPPPPKKENISDISGNGTGTF